MQATGARTAPLRSLRIRREPLGSKGSHHPAVGRPPKPDVKVHFCHSWLSRPGTHASAWVVTLTGEAETGKILQRRGSDFERSGEMTRPTPFEPVLGDPVNGCCSLTIEAPTHRFRCTGGCHPAKAILRLGARPVALYCLAGSHPAASDGGATRPGARTGMHPPQNRQLSFTFVNPPSERLARVRNPKITPAWREKEG